MYAIRFKIQCRPDKANEVKAALAKVVAPSRVLDGVLGFDIGQDVTDPSRFIATEVFVDEDAQTRQESQAEVAAVMALFPSVLAAPPEVTVFHVSTSEDLAV